MATGFLSHDVLPALFRVAEPLQLVISSYGLVSIHVFAGRTTVLDASRCMDTNNHKRSQPLQQKPASSQQPHTCWTFVRPVPRYAVILCPPKKIAKLKTKKITTVFGKSLFLIKYRMRYATSMPPNTKDLAINQAMVGYGNWLNATAFARANNSNLLRSLKHSMETRLNILGWSLFLHLMATGNSE